MHPGPEIEPLALAPAQGEGESQAVAVAGPPVLVPAQGEGDSPAVPRAKAKGRARNIGNEAVCLGKHFWIAKTYRHGEFKAVTATCKHHQREGHRCNQWVTVNDSMDAAEAERRLKEWCVRGMSIPDAPGSRRSHMDDKCNQKTKTAR